MIEHTTYGILAVVIESIGLLLCRKEITLLLAIATVMTIILFFLV